MREVFCSSPSIKIESDDRDPVNGNSSHNYAFVFESEEDKSAGCLSEQRVVFQHGPIKEVGINGITIEALVDVILDRLRGFQEGGFSCVENDMALHHFTQGLNYLNARTKRREARGVEGRNEK
jgi:hypothetical protein